MRGVATFATMVKYTSAKYSRITLKPIHKLHVFVNFKKKFGTNIKRNLTQRCFPSE